jgi:hypothetical protein
MVFPALGAPPIQKIISFLLSFWLTDNYNREGETFSFMRAGNENWAGFWRLPSA